MKKLTILCILLAFAVGFADSNEYRSKQIAVGSQIIKSVRTSLDSDYAEKLAMIIYDESDVNSQIEYPFLLAVIAVESRFNTNAISPAGATGLGQLMPRTAERMAKHAGLEYSKSRLTEPLYNIKLSVQFLKNLYRKFGNSVLVAAAYNGGPVGARKYKKWMDGEAERDSVHKETVAYVSKVMEKYNAYRLLLK